MSNRHPEPPVDDSHLLAAREARRAEPDYCEVCDEVGCVCDGAPEHQWQVTTPEAVYATEEEDPYEFEPDER